MKQPTKTMTVSELKANFSSVIIDLKQGRRVAITYGRSKQPLATLVPHAEIVQPDYSIEVGGLRKAGWTYKMKDFEMTEEELLGL